MNSHQDSPYGNPAEDGLDRINSKDDSDYDNYWNKEGVFEYESDKGDQILDAMDDAGETEDPQWRIRCEEPHEQEHDESYQQWAMEEEKRNEEIERAIERFYETQED